MTSNGPELARARLARLMDDRRLELGLTWDEVAKRANIHRETLRQVRQGKSELRPLTRRGLESALEWEVGSVQAVLEGREPVTAEGDNVEVGTGAPEPDDPVKRAREMLREGRALIERAERILGGESGQPDEPDRSAS